MRRGFDGNIASSRSRRVGSKRRTSEVRSNKVALTDEPLGMGCRQRTRQQSSFGRGDTN